MPGIMLELAPSSEVMATLGITTYLIGQACGCLVLAPLSELYGRRPVYLGALIVFCAMTIPAATANNIETILIMRFLRFVHVGISRTCVDDSKCFCRGCNGCKHTRKRFRCHSRRWPLCGIQSLEHRSYERPHYRTFDWRSYFAIYWMEVEYLAHLNFRWYFVSALSSH